MPPPQRNGIVKREIIRHGLYKDSHKRPGINYVVDNETFRFAKSG